MSRLELFYADRIVDELHQYGYDLFNSNNAHYRPNHVSPSRPVASINRDSIIIGTGDTLEIIFRGQINTQQDYTISPQGLLILDQLAPISVRGMSLKQLQERLDIEAKNLVNTKIYVTLKTIRNIGITISGHVDNPGFHTLSAANTVMDALRQAGGINKKGTLRNIKLVRDGQSKAIDLYSLLQNGTSRADIPLRDGDKIIVPSIGDTIAITGDVKNPAIYEIPKGHKYALASLFGLSGGLLSPSEYRFIKLGLNNKGQEITQNIDNLAHKQFGDGSILVVARRTQNRKGAVELKESPTGNAVNTKGLHDINQARQLSDLLPDRASFGNDIYPLFGLIERWNDKTLAPEYLTFSPMQIVNKSMDMNLQQNDKIHFFSRQDINALNMDDSESSVIKDHKSNKKHAEMIQQILKEHAVYVRGAVRQEGLFPIHSDSEIQDILSVTGGFTIEADPTKVEITQNHDGNIYRQTINVHADTALRHFLVEPGDTIRVNTQTKIVAEKTVHLYGEVKSPGRYDLMPGDTLLTLLERAGGISAQAYPDGTIFSRKTERIRQEQQYHSKAKDLRMKLASMMQAEDKPDIEKIRILKTLIKDLEEAKTVGRITVESDPEILKTHPELDPLLENGDKIYIPKRPMTVRVAGEVLSPNALQFRSEKTPLEYIREAGGYSYHADKKRAFFIKPDGSAQPLKASYWTHQANFIPPGSTIIVPRDPKPFDFVESAKDISQIVANLAVTAVLTDELGDGD